MILIRKLPPGLPGIPSVGSNWTLRIKMRRIADVVIAGALLAITLPLMLGVALAIRFEGPGPILDRLSCTGRGGRRFQMLKFRTMVHDPEGTLPVWARKRRRSAHSFARRELKPSRGSSMCSVAR
jgi:lipopolysaccharide/colanic/teichoic acid biosynthesis glycosyltransferase